MDQGHAGLPSFPYTGIVSAALGFRSESKNLIARFGLEDPMPNGDTDQGGYLVLSTFTKTHFSVEAAATSCLSKLTILSVNSASALERIPDGFSVSETVAGP